MSNFEDLGKRGKEQQPHNRTSAHDNPDATDAASTHSDNNEQAQSQPAIGNRSTHPLSRRFFDRTSIKESLCA